MLRRRDTVKPDQARVPMMLARHPRGRNAGAAPRLRLRQDNRGLRGGSSRTTKAQRGSPAGESPERSTPSQRSESESCVSRGNRSYKPNEASGGDGKSERPNSTEGVRGTTPRDPEEGRGAPGCALSSRSHTGDRRHMPPTAAHTLREIRARSMHLRRPAQPSGIEGNPHRKATP